MSTAEAVVWCVAIVCFTVVAVGCGGTTRRRGYGHRPRGNVREGGPPPGGGGVARPRRKLPPPNLDLIDTKTPGGREVKRRIEKRLKQEGHMPPPPRGVEADRPPDDDPRSMMSPFPVL